MASQLYDPNSQTYSPGGTSFGTAPPYNPSAGAVGGGAGGINTNSTSIPLTMTGSSTAPAFSNSPAPPTDAGLQPGQGTPGDVGYNVNVPGAGENVSASYLALYGQNGTPTASNNAQQAYTDFRNSTPANMDPYYDNAQRNSANDINKQMAARGQYGSSNAVGVLSNASTNLRAQEAKDNAQYGISRYGLEGQLASGSDASSVNQSQNEENWMKGLTDLGFANEKEGAARAQLGLDWTKGAADTASGIEGSVGASEIAADKDLLIKQLTASGMSYADAAAAADNRVAAGNAQDARATATVTSALAYMV